MKVVPGKTILGTPPAFSRIIAFEKSPGGSHKVEIFPVRGAADVMDIEIIDSAAHIFPRLAAIETADDAAVFQTDMDDAWMIRMDKNMSHVFSMRWPGITPVFFPFRGKILNAVRLSPSLSLSSV